MKSPAKKIIIAIICGSVLLNAGLSLAQTNYFFSTGNEIEICSSEDAESAERKREFWEKFRESVTPREKDPPETDTPKEVHPEEVNPKEVKPEKAKPEEVMTREVI